MPPEKKLLILDAIEFGEGKHVDRIRKLGVTANVYHQLKLHSKFNEGLR